MKVKLLQCRFADVYVGQVLDAVPNEKLGGFEVTVPNIPNPIRWQSKEVRTYFFASHEVEVLPEPSPAQYGG